MALEWLLKEWRRRHPKTLEEISLDDAFYGTVSPENIIKIYARETGVRFNPTKNTLICPKCNTETPVRYDASKEQYCKCGERISPEYRHERAVLNFGLWRIKERRDREEAYYKKISALGL